MKRYDPNRYDNFPPTISPSHRRIQASQVFGISPRHTENDPARNFDIRENRCESKIVYGRPPFLVFPLPPPWRRVGVPCPLCPALPEAVSVPFPLPSCSVPRLRPAPSRVRSPLPPSPLRWETLRRRSRSGSGVPFRAPASAFRSLPRACFRSCSRSRSCSFRHRNVGAPASPFLSVPTSECRRADIFPTFRPSSV